MSKSTIVTPDGSNWIEILYTGRNKVCIECNMPHSDVIPLAYVLRDNGLPAVDIDINESEQPSGIITLMFDNANNTELDDRTIESISTAFEQYFDRRLSAFASNQLGLVPGVV